MRMPSSVKIRFHLTETLMFHRINLFLTSKGLGAIIPKSTLIVLNIQNVELYGFPL